MSPVSMPSLALLPWRFRVSAEDSAGAIRAISNHVGKCRISRGEGASWRPRRCPVAVSAGAGDLGDTELRKACLDRRADAGQVQARHAQHFLAAAVLQVDV